MRALRIVTAVVLASSLAACGWVRVPARAPAAAAPAVPHADGADSERVVTVAPGDTLYGIARAHDVPLRGLIVMNDLQPPYRLTAGQRLRIPAAARLHRVGQGDTAYGIARRYGVEVAGLVRANALDSPDRVLLGQQLVIPGPGRQQPPSPTGSVAAAPVALGPAPDAAAVEVQPLGPPGPAAPATAPAATEPREPEPAPAPTRAGGGRFVMPVEGRIVSEFGPKVGGRQNDGINIAAPRGTPVRAAAAGTVVYAGNELPGYGNLVLIKHEGGWITAYGHNDSMLVSRGQTVRRGETIARVGSSGNVGDPQLHFEIRQGSRAVDPRQHLRGV